MSYRAGDVENQRGPSFTEKDYNRMYKVITANTSDPVTFEKAVTQYMKNVRSNLKQEGKQFNDGMTDYKQYEKDFGAGSAPTAGIVEDFDEVVKNSGNPAAMESLDKMTKAQHDAPAPAETEDRHEPVDLTAIPAEAIADLKKSPQTAAKFDEWYGEGAADAVLGKVKASGSNR
jgi:hypothetical protein